MFGILAEIQAVRENNIGFINNDRFFKRMTIPEVLHRCVPVMYKLNCWYELVPEERYINAVNYL